MNTEEVKNAVREYVKENAFSDQDKITNDVLIFKEVFLDSMSHVILIPCLEYTFNIKTSDSDMVEENFESINAIAEFVEKKSA